ncbi:MAG: flagellar hook-basal body protein [Phycisphaerae bacterium]
MIYGLWQSAAGLQAQKLRLDVFANNVANVDTPGFKPDAISLVERLTASQGGTALGEAPYPPHPTLDRQTGGVTFSPTYTDFSTAAPVTTGNALDLAIDGDGFFSVRTEQGVRYTRNGRLTMRVDGTLVTAAGAFEVLSTAGRPIRVNPSAGAIQVGADGRVRQGDTVLARLGIVDFADRQRLEKTGRNLFEANGAPPKAATGEVRQFAYESSGVNSVTGLVRMIEAQRAYQLNATMITIQDQTLGRVVNDVGRLA